MANANNLVKSKDLTITCDYPIVNVHSTWPDNNYYKVVKTEKSGISASDVLQKYSYGFVIKTEPAHNRLSECPLRTTDKPQLQENSTPGYSTENSLLIKKVEPNALMDNHGTLNPLLNQMTETAPFTSSERNIIKIEKPDISVQDLLLPHSCESVIKTEPSLKRFSEGQLMKTEKQEGRENNTRRNVAEPLCLAENGDPTALIENHGTLKPDLNKMMESVPTRTSTRRTSQQGSHIAEKPFPCDICDKRFTHAGHLLRHKRLHSGEKYFLCDLCDKQFTQASALVRHERSHTGEKPFACKECGKRFGNASTLEQHKRSHTGEKLFVCDVCSKRYSRSSALVTHKRSHTGEKPFVCDWCDKRFSQNSSLLSHKRTHTGEKPFACDECGKRFRHGSTLRQHKRCHTGEKPFVCDVCNKRFSNGSNLVTHKRSHTGEKPFVCDQCDKRFSEAYKLTTHKRSHTLEKQVVAKDLHSVKSGPRFILPAQNKSYPVVEKVCLLKITLP